MRTFSTATWPVRRGMLLAGVVAAGSSLMSLCLSPRVLFILAAILLLSLLVPQLRQPVWVYIVVWAVLFLATGGMYRAHTVVPQHRLAGECDTIAATVVELPAAGHMVTVEITEAQKLPVGSRVLLYCSDQLSPSYNDVLRGEVELRALYTTQYRYQADRVFLQAYPTVYGEEAMGISSPTPSLASYMTELRERLVDALRERLTDEEGALLAGLCLGDKTAISDATNEAFRRAGLPHLLVVSGLHLSVIGAGAYLVLQKLLRHRRTAACVSMAAVYFFMLLVGFTPSVVRAGVACLVMLGGQLFTRRADGLNSLGLALVLLLVYSPYCLLDVGLQLSFGATAGVLCLTTPVQVRLYRLHVWKPLADALAVTVAASLPIIPLLGSVFNEVSVVSPVANIFAVMPSSAALVIGCLAMLFMLISPLSFIAQGLLYLAAWLMRWLMLVAETFGGLTFATVSTVRLWTMVYLTGGCGLVILCLCSQKAGLLRRVLALLSATALLTAWADARMRESYLCIGVSLREDSAMLVLEQNGRYGMLVQDAAGLSVDNEWLLTCDGELDFLVVGDGETADAARVTAFMQEVCVERLLVGGDARFLTGLHVPFERLFEHTAIGLWENTVLTVDDGWLLDYHGTSLAVSPQGQACAADGVVFVGEPPPAGSVYTAGQGVLLTEQPSDIALALAEALPYPVMTTSDARVYFMTNGSGEWSVTRWQ